MNETSVDFNSDNQDFIREHKPRRGLVGLTMRLFGLKSEQSANTALLFFALAVFLVALIIFFVSR